MNLSSATTRQLLLDIASEYGLPLYVYDGNKIETQYDRLVHAFETDKLEIHYACKANTNNQILKLLHRKGAKLDIVSLNEAKLALKCGYKASEIHFTPNGAPFEEYAQALKDGYSLSVDSLPIIERIADEYPGAELCIRINPKVYGGAHQKIAVGHKESKFGLSLDYTDHLLHLQNEGRIKVAGLHIHAGSDIYNLKTIRKGAKVLLKTAERFTEHLEYLDFGGGFKVPYAPDDERINITEIGRWITKKVKEFDEIHGTQLKVKIEPGKYLVSEAGLFLARVSQLKDTHGIKFAYLQAGFNHFIRPMYYNASHYITQLSNYRGVHEMYNIVGYLCETDTFASARSLPKIKVGDILCFHNAGAYAFTMASNYNLRERPAEVLVHNKDVKLIQKREEFQDLINGQVW